MSGEEGGEREGRGEGEGEGWRGERWRERREGEGKEGRGREGERRRECTRKEEERKWATIGVGCSLVFPLPVSLHRCEYDSTCCLLISLFDQTASAYQKLLQGSYNSPELPLREGESTGNPQPAPCMHAGHMLYVHTCAGQMTWLIYLIGSFIGGRLNQYSATDYANVDGQLICRYADTQVCTGAAVGMLCGCKQALFLLFAHVYVCLFVLSTE